MKKLILVTSPPACGKTFISKELAKAIEHVVYLDKDTLIGLSKQIFKVAGQEYNRSSDFFNQNIRDYESTDLYTCEFWDSGNIISRKSFYQKQYNDTGRTCCITELYVTGIG